MRTISAELRSFEIDDVSAREAKEFTLQSRFSGVGRGSSRKLEARLTKPHGTGAESYDFSHDPIKIGISAVNDLLPWV